MPVRIVSVMPLVISTTLLVVGIAALFIAPTIIFAPTNSGALAFVVVVAIFLLLFPIFNFIVARLYQQARVAAANRDDARTHIVPVQPTQWPEPVIEARVTLPQWSYALNGLSALGGLIVVVIFFIFAVAFAPNISRPGWLFPIVGSVYGIFIIATCFGLAFQLDRSVYQVRADDAGLTVARRWTKRFIPWSDIRLVYDVAASHPFQILNSARLLWPYFTSDPMLYQSFIYGRMLGCYEVASARTRVLITLLSQDPISQYGPLRPRSPRAMLNQNMSLGVRASLLRFDDYSTFPQRMLAILSMVVERSHIEMRARNH